MYFSFYLFIFSYKKRVQRFEDITAEPVNVTLPLPDCCMHSTVQTNTHKRARHACPINIFRVVSRARELRPLSHTILSKLHSPGFFPTRQLVFIRVFFFFRFIIFLFPHPFIISEKQFNLKFSFDVISPKRVLYCNIIIFDHLAAWKNLLWFSRILYDLW